MAGQGGELPTVSIGHGDRTVATALDTADPAISDDIKEIITSASTRWLKNEEVLAILESFQLDAIEWPKEASERPDGGKLFLFNRKLCRAFRSDKHNWRKKNDGRTVKETHEKLKVGDRERLNCYYAHAEDSDGLQRRCYWILETPKDDVVMVHYLRSSTSRVGPRGGGTSAGPSRVAGGGSSGAGGAGPSRPQRAAAQRSRYTRYGDFALDSDEEDAGGADGTPSPPRTRATAPGPTLEPIPLQGIPIEVAALPIVTAPGLMPPPLPPGPAGGVPVGGTALSPAPPLDLSLSLGEGMESIDFAAALGRLDSKLDSMADIPFMKKLPDGSFFVENPKDLPSLAEQDAAARNAGRDPLGHFLFTGVPPVSPPGSAAARPGVAAAQGGGPGQPPRRLVHDPLGSGDGTVMLPSMSLGIAHTQDTGAAAGLHGLFPSATVDTTGMFQLTDGRKSSGSADQASGQPGSPDSKAPRAPLPPFPLGRPRAGTVITSGMAVPSLGSGDFEAALPPELQAGAVATGAGAAAGAEGPGLYRNDSSFGATDMEASGEAPGEGSGKERGAAAAAAAVAETDAAGTDAEPRRGLYHQESSVAAKMAADTASEPPKVETLRRLVAPGFRGSGSNPSLADVARRASGGATTSEDDSAAVPGGAHAPGHRRRNPTAAPSPLSATERVAAAGTAAAAVTAEHREEKVHRLRASRYGGTAPDQGGWDGGAGDDDGAALIETTQSPLFRITSHVVGTAMADIQAAVAEADGPDASNGNGVAEASALMKEMSIDKITDGDKAGMLFRNMSIDDRDPAAAAAAAEAEQPQTSDGEGEPCSPPRDHVAGSPPRGFGAFGSDQEAVTPPTTGPNTDEPGTRDPSLSSLLEAGLSMQAVGGGAGDAGGGGLQSEDVLRAAFERQQALAEAKAAGRSPAAQ